MFDKLDFILEKYRELEQKVSDPEIINNQPVWQKYIKEMAEMERKYLAEDAEVDADLPGEEEEVFEDSEEAEAEE